MFTLTWKEAADISAFAELSAISRFMYLVCWLSDFLDQFNINRALSRTVVGALK